MALDRMSARSRDAVLFGGICLWIAVGGGIGLGVLSEATDSGRKLVAAALAIGVAAGVGAALDVMLRSGRRTAGLLLVVSAIAMPTAFGLPLNLVALAVGIGIAVRAGREARRWPDLVV